MKKFIALAVLASSTVSFAASSDIYDIMYLPSPGTTYGFTTAEMVDQTIEFDGGAEMETEGNVYSQTIGHAFTDRLSVQASFTYADLETEMEGFDDTKSTGLSDPTVTARFRTLDESARWDLIGGALISTGDSETKSDGDTDNLQGGHSLFIGTQYGVKSENMQWAVLGQLTHNMEAKTDDKENDENVKDDSNNVLLIRGDILNKLAEKSYLRSFLSANFTEKFDDNQDASTPPTTTYTIGTEYQHILSQDVMLRAGVDYSMVNANTAQIDEWQTWTYRIGANYQF